MADGYDVAVLGAGGGGYPAALRLARAGLRVLVIDPKGNLGGNCLSEGCIPSKAVREPSLLASQVRRSAFFGLSGGLEPPSWPAVRAYNDGIQARRYEQHRREVATVPGVTLVRGQASFLDGHRLHVANQAAGQDRQVRAGLILLATGSVAASLPIPGFEHAWNDRDLFAYQDS